MKWGNIMFKHKDNIESVDGAAIDDVTRTILKLQKKDKKRRIIRNVLIVLSVVVILVFSVYKITEYIKEYKRNTEDRNFKNYVHSEMSKLYGDVDVDTDIEEFRSKPGYLLTVRFKVNRNYPTGEEYKNHFPKEAADLREICIKYSEQHKEERYGKVTEFRISTLILNTTDENEMYYDWSNRIEFHKNYDDMFKMKENETGDNISLRDLDKMIVHVQNATLSDLRYFSDCKQIIALDLYNIYWDCDFSEFKNLRCFGYRELGSGSYPGEKGSKSYEEVEEKLISNLPKDCQFAKATSEF